MLSFIALRMETNFIIFIYWNNMDCKCIYVYLFTVYGFLWNMSFLMKNASLHIYISIPNNYTYIFWSISVVGIYYKHKWPQLLWSSFELWSICRAPIQSLQSYQLSPCATHVVNIFYCWLAPLNCHAYTNPALAQCLLRCQRARVAQKSPLRLCAESFNNTYFLIALAPSALNSHRTALID